MKYQRDSEKEKKKKKNRVDDTVTTSLYISPTFNRVKKKKERERERKQYNETLHQPWNYQTEEEHVKDKTYQKQKKKKIFYLDLDI